MKRSDLIFIGIFLLIFLPFFLFREAYDFYFITNKQHGLVMSFVKFSVLATMGEMLGQRIRKGNYWKEGFGLIPRMIVWGLLGLLIKIAFVVFTGGAII